MPIQRRHKAFSLVELSIVLVILGLLVGGILSGQSLIRAAELRAVTTEYQKYSTAVYSFRDKYFAIPGDFSNATAFWGKDNAACAGNTGTAATPGTCNGNGDGVINFPGVASATGEPYRLWQHLALAGLIEGTYTGLAGPSAINPGDDFVVGTNTPKSRITNSGWADQNYNSGVGDGYTYSYDFGNMLAIGGQTTGNIPLAPIFKPEEAWNIDTKIDDGMPGRGKVWIRTANAWTTANACSSATSQTDYTSGYNLSNSTLSCVLWFAKAF